MDHEEIKKAQLLVWDISKKKTLNYEEITAVARTMRRLIDAYTGATKKLFKLRSRLRGEND